MSNIVIIGSGPAGVSAALYTARAGVDTTVLTRGPGALDRAEGIQNYYGFAAPISGAELERQGIEGAKAVGVKFVTTEAVGLTYTDKLTVETLDGVPRIPGLAGLEGHGVSYCAACDAFFYRGRDVAVVGSGEYALHEVQALLPVASSVTLLLNGAPLAAQFPPEVTVRPEKIDAVLGEQKVTGVQLAGGEVVELAGVFIALGVAGSTALARKIGAAVENNRIVTDGKMQTTVPGLYAAGDCTGGLLQVAKAVYEGALAGTEAAKALRKECRGERVHSPVENCVGILLLRTGQFRAYLLSDDGRDVTLYRLFGGEICILSASCVMDSVNFDLYIDAEEDTEAYCISAGVFRSLMQQNVEVRCFAYQMTAERFSDTMWTMQQILFMSADRRLAIFLADELAKTGGEDVRLTQDQMAKYMGSAREVVSRLLKYFAGEGIVKLYRGGVEVLDKERLNRIARGEA